MRCAIRVNAARGDVCLVAIRRDQTMSFAVYLEGVQTGRKMGLGSRSR